ncbi:hypothetical protein ACXR2T_10070 [Leucobacter sp. HY1910]
MYTGPSNITFATATMGGVHTKGCFACHGTGKYTVKVSSYRARVAREEKRQAEAAKRRAETEARHEAFMEKHGDIARRVVDIREQLNAGDPFRNKFGALLDDLQGTALTDDFDEEEWAERASVVLTSYDAREQAKRPVPVGRITLSGAIQSAKYVDSAYGATLKMLVEGDGWKVWGSVPKQIADAEYDAFYAADESDPAYDGIEVWTRALIGRSITFTATVKPSDDDASFGFFTRPTQATISTWESA